MDSDGWMQTDTASFFPRPAGIHYDRYACKQREFTCKHKTRKTFEASFNTTSKSYAPQPATLAGQEETPRWLSSIPKCMQSCNCCPAQKLPQNTHCTHTRHGVTSQIPSWNKRCSEARTQAAKQCLWVNPGSSSIHFYNCFSQILTPASKGCLSNTLFVHLKRKPSTSNAAAGSKALSWQRLHHQAALSISFQWLLRILNNSATFVCKLSVSFHWKTIVSFC